MTLTCIHPISLMNAGTKAFVLSGFLRLHNNTIVHICVCACGGGAHFKTKATGPQYKLELDNSFAESGATGSTGLPQLNLLLVDLF